MSQTTVPPATKRVLVGTREVSLPLVFKTGHEIDFKEGVWVLMDSSYRRWSYPTLEAALEARLTKGRRHGPRFTNGAPSEDT
jgi:hypothetical protein